MSNYKIRVKERINSSPREGERQSWTEYQVMEGRTIVYRGDTQEQAERFIANAEGRT
jgi:hypothetical protein